MDGGLDPSEAIFKRRNLDRKVEDLRDLGQMAGRTIPKASNVAQRATVAVVDPFKTDSCAIIIYKKSSPFPHDFYRSLNAIVYQGGASFGFHVDGLWHP